MSIKVAEYQKIYGLNPDGVIGRITFGSMVMNWELTPIQLAHFLGQCEHETGGFKFDTENLNYSAAALVRVWPNRYTEDLAKKHERKPSVIANHVYGGRMGNDRPNDGWTFIGRGAIQLTGRSNYQRFSEWVKDANVMVNPSLVAKQYFFSAGLWYFLDRHIFDLCTDLEESTIIKISKAINLGSPVANGIPNGINERIELTLKYKQFIT